MLSKFYLKPIVGLLSCMVALQQPVGAVRPGGRNGHHHAGHTRSASVIDYEPTSAIASQLSTAIARTSSFPTASTSTSAVVSSPSARVGGKPDVFIPLYMYPFDGAWSGLEEVISAHPNTRFTVVINPDSGPGSNTVQDEGFVAAIPRLNAYSNVRVLGYVHTSYGGREISAVEKDIETYAGWPSSSGNPSFAVSGIFLDETPATATENIGSYYKQLTSYTKSQSGLGPDNYVVTNPGTVPDASLLSIPDITVVFEASYAEFQQQIAVNRFDALSGVDRSKLATIICSVPSSADLSTLVQQAGDVSGHVYASNSNSYTTFDSSSSEVLHVLAA